MKPLIIYSMFAAAGVLTASAVPVTVFTTDFNSGVPVELSGVTTTTGVQGYSGIGSPGNQFSGDFLRNTTLGSPTVLTLSGLPAHTSVDLNFLLAVIDSWDGATGPSPGGDFFNIRIDGGAPLVSSFDLFNSGDEVILPGTALLFSGQNLGFNSWGDAAYDFSSTGALSFPHTSSTLVVEFYSSGGGFQGGEDESWAIDNLSVIIDVNQTGVPDAGASALLMGLGVAGLISLKRRSA